MALKVTINGQPREFEELKAGATVLDLIGELQLKSDRVALEHNGEIASRRAWGETALADGDKVEIVHFVGGGSAARRCGCGQCGEQEAGPPNHPDAMKLHPEGSKEARV